jgi:toxin ParE1/3/4
LHGRTEFPNIGRPGRIPDTRELVVVDTHFIVPYRVRDAEIEILSVFHGARSAYFDRVELPDR